MDSKSREIFREELITNALEEFPGNVAKGMADSIIDLFVIVENLRKERSYWLRRAMKTERQQSAGYMRRKGHPSDGVAGKPHEPCETDDWITTGRE